VDGVGDKSNRSLWANRVRLYGKIFDDEKRYYKFEDISKIPQRKERPKPTMVRTPVASMVGVSR